MAGINFELRKVFKENSIGHTMVGAAYSTIITIGPTLISMAVIGILYLCTGYMNIAYTQRELLAATILYCFIFPVIISSVSGAVLSRYIADKFYEEKYEDIIPSYYVGLLISIIIALALGLPFVIRLIYIGDVELVYAILSFVLYMIMNVLFFSMTYLYATKDYKTITLAFVGGLLTGVGVVFALKELLDVPVDYSILIGITVGFFLTTVILVAYIKSYFCMNSHKYMEALKYFGKYKGLIASNFLYYLGLYVHNFVFWSTPMRMEVADSYVMMQPYDMASSLALFTNISTIIIFTVMAETDFHEKYQKYIETIIGSTFEEIERRKQSMFRLLGRIISHVFSIQLIITITLYLIIIIFLPQLGFGGVTMEIYPALAVAYLVIFLMYCNIVFLYYFDDVKGAVLTSTVFLLVTLGGAIYATNLSAVWYGLGVILGGLMGWTVSFFRIRYMQKHFDRHIFCKVKILEEKNKKVVNNVVYDNRIRQEVADARTKN